MKTKQIKIANSPKTKLCFGIITTVAFITLGIFWFLWDGNKSELPPIETEEVSEDEISLVQKEEIQSGIAPVEEILNDEPKEIRKSKKKQAKAKSVSSESKPDSNPEITRIQEEKLAEEEESEKIWEIWESVEVKPEFPGGTIALYQFLGENMVYPQQAAEENIQGTVVVSFVVEKDGSVNHVNVVKGRHYTLDREAVRVVKMLPPFIPAQQNGYNVRVYYSLPIRFKLV